MSHMTSIIRKEVRELLTPGSVISVLVMVVLFAGLGGLIGGEVDSAAELPTFGTATTTTGGTLTTSSATRRTTVRKPIRRSSSWKAATMRILPR